jgi:hypothetical protein
VPGGDKKDVDQTLMLALACGATKEAAARKAGVSESTVYRRLNEPGFLRELNELRRDMVQRASGMLTAATLEAAKTLLALQDPSMPPAVRLGAARATLDFGMKIRQIVELEERLVAVETLLAERNGR